MNLRLVNFKNWFKKYSAKILILGVITLILLINTIYSYYIDWTIIPLFLSLTIILTIWYILFSPSTKTIFLIAIVLLLMSYLLVIVRINVLVDFFGEIFYILFILIFINLLKDLKDQK